MRHLRASLALAMTAMLVIAAMGPGTFGYVGTDQDDYAPGSVVTISGGNDAAGAPGYVPGETVHVDVSGPNGWTATCEGAADDAGAWSCQITLDPDPAIAVGDYSYTAAGLESGVTESGTFTDALFKMRAMFGSTPIIVTFLGGTGLTSSMVGYANSTCTSPTNKFHATNLPTLADGNFVNPTIATAAGSSNKVTAPATAIYLGTTYAFSSWSIVNSTGGTTGLLNGSVTTTGTAGCFSGWNVSFQTFVQANYVLATGTLVVNKTLANDPGKVGDKTADDFQFDVAGPTASSNNVFEGDGSNSLTVDPGSYTVTEDGPNAGYTTTYSTDCTSGTVTAGGTTTCTVTNTFNGYSTSATTQVLDEEDADVTNTTLPLGTKVHDTIAVSGRLPGLTFAGTNTVDFKLFSGNNCGVDSGTQIYATETVDITDNGNGQDGTAASAERELAVGQYSYLASYSGNSSYLGSTAACEPFEIACPNCEEVTVDVDENVAVNVAAETCDDGLTNDLCDYVAYDKPGLDPSQWNAVFDLGGKKLVIRDNVTVRTVNVPSSTNNQKAPGIVIKGCELIIEGDVDLNGTPGRVLVQAVNQQAGDIVLEFEGNVTINGIVRDEVTGTNGRPGEITIASCCGDIVTGPKSRIETIGVSATGGADINILTCCDRGYAGAGGDIVINGLVLAQHKAGTAPTINVVALVGAVTVNGTNQFGLETVNGTQFNRTSGLLVHTVNATDGGDINVQAKDDVTVIGNSVYIANRPNFGAIAIKTNNTNFQGGNGTIDVQSLEGNINATDRSFDLENRFNHTIDTFINLFADGDINLSVTGAKKFVVSSQGGSGGQGGTNNLTGGNINVGPNVQVLANAPGGANGVNNFCGTPNVDGTAEVNPAAINFCAPAPFLFTSCEQFDVFFEQDVHDLE